MIFLLIQLTYCRSDSTGKTQRRIGLTNPWTEYVKFLPSSIPLPTVYSEEERELLRGTSLQAAVDSKSSVLEREFEHLRQSTRSIQWCRDFWWSEEKEEEEQEEENDEVVTIDDWKYVDAVYRSRMLDLPGYGHSMVPCIDMVNHATGVEANALYEKDNDGNAVLQIRPGKKIQPGDEITISCVLSLTSTPSFFG